MAAQAAQQLRPTLNSPAAEWAATEEYLEALEMNHVHQDGWILNAITAKHLAFQ